jgi:hypothetical protein
MVTVSIIAPHHHESTPKVRFDGFLQSLRDQTCRDFECIVIHDGPFGFPIPKEWFEGTNLIFIESKERTKAGGNKNRQEAMNLATGKWLMQTSSDNVYDKDAVGNIIEQDNGKIQALVFPVKMVGLERDGNAIHYSSPRDYTKSTILHGNPVKVGNIDLMQMVATKDIYHTIGGWFDTTHLCDGIVYEKIAVTTPVRFVDKVIGEHW